MDNDTVSGSTQGIQRPAQGIGAAREQVEAARARQQRLIATGKLDRPILDHAISGKVLPGYRLLRELHRGGQGIVYLAVQESTERQVAIKILHHGPLATAHGGLVRFRREIDILSRLRHPNIVTVHDCGRDHEQVYLVMDYVAGCPLDEYVQKLSEGTETRGEDVAASEQSRAPSQSHGAIGRQSRARSPKSTVEAVVRLFTTVCDGVNAAHLRGVIHRDLKPGNILVDQHGEPRVLDFGLAKLMDDSSEAPPPHAMTVTGQFVGSLPWASPEQAEGRTDSLDIRTDVYSLGVLLYQLLTGQFPYPVSGRISEVVHNIVHSDPARPSSIQRFIDRELETILLKSLAKEPERRYQSAGDLARDLRRYLANEPIEARRDSLRYVLSKRLARYRVAAIAATAVLLVALSALGVSLTFWHQADQQRSLAQSNATAAQQAAARADEEAANARRQTEIAQATVAFLTHDLLAGADSGQQKGRSDVTVREMVDQAAARLYSGESLRLVPPEVRDTVKSAVRCAIARTYRSLGLYDQAHAQARAAVDAAREAQPVQSALLADALYELGEVHRARQETAEARAALTESLELATRAYSENSMRLADVTNALAGVELFSGQYAEAERLSRQALVIKQRILGPRHAHVAMMMGNLGQCLARLGRIDEAAEMVRQAADIHRELFSEDGHEYARDIFILGNIYTNGGNPGLAEPYFREALARLQKLYPPEHPLIAMCRRNLGFVLLGLDQSPEAEELFRAALEVERKAAGQSGSLITNALSGLSRALLNNGKFDEAQRVLIELEQVLQANYVTEGDRWRAAEVLSLRGEAIVGAVRAGGEISPEEKRMLFREAERLLTGSFETITSTSSCRERFMTDKASRRCEAARRLVALYELWRGVEDLAPSADRQRIHDQFASWSAEFERLKEADANTAYTTN